MFLSVPSEPAERLGAPADHRADKCVGVVSVNPRQPYREEKAPLPNSWFRLYSEFSDDPKVQMMPEVMQRRLVMLFCERNKGETLHETERAFHWRISDQELAETKAIFIQQGFIDESWDLLNWRKRQFVSDSSSERVKRYRERMKRMKQNVTNAPLQDRFTVNDHETFHSVSDPLDSEDSCESLKRYVTPTDTEKKKTIARRDVERIYDAYPRKVGKDAALKAIEKALRRIDQTAEWLLGRVQAYAEVRRTEDPQFTPHPATWFNQGRYLDEALEPKQKPIWGDLATGEPIQ